MDLFQGADEVGMGFVALGKLPICVLALVPVGTHLAFRDDILRDLQNVFRYFHGTVGDDQFRKRHKVARGQRDCAAIRSRQRAQIACCIAVSCHFSSGPTNETLGALFVRLVAVSDGKICHFYPSSKEIGEE